MNKLVTLDGKQVVLTRRNIEDYITNYSYSPVDEVIYIYHKKQILCILPSRRSNYIENKFIDGDELYLFGLSVEDILHAIKGSLG